MTPQEVLDTINGEHCHLNVGCGPFRTNMPNWINTDVAYEPGLIEPDVIVTVDDPIPFPAYSFDRIYMGHVLEHVPWEHVVSFVKLAREALKSEGEIMIVCPDVNRAIDQVIDGRQDRHWLNGIIEDDRHYQQHQPGWFGARHCWNAYEERIVRVLNIAGFTNIRTIDFNDPSQTDGWPITSHASWQCGAKATIR